MQCLQVISICQNARRQLVVLAVSLSGHRKQQASGEIHNAFIYNRNIGSKHKLYITRDRASGEQLSSTIPGRCLRASRWLMRGLRTISRFIMHALPSPHRPASSDALSCIPSPPPAVNSRPVGRSIINLKIECFLLVVILSLVLMYCNIDTPPPAENSSLVVRSIIKLCRC